MSWRSTARRWASGREWPSGRSAPLSGPVHNGLWADKEKRRATGTGACQSLAATCCALAAGACTEGRARCAGSRPGGQDGGAAWGPEPPGAAGGSTGRAPPLVECTALATVCLPGRATLSHTEAGAQSALLSISIFAYKAHNCPAPQAAEAAEREAANLRELASIGNRCVVLQTELDLAKAEASG